MTERVRRDIPKSKQSLSGAGANLQSTRFRRRSLGALRLERNGLALDRWGRGDSRHRGVLSSGRFGGGADGV